MMLFYIQLRTMNQFEIDLKTSVFLSKKIHFNVLRPTAPSLILDKS